MKSILIFISICYFPLEGCKTNPLASKEANINIKIVEEKVVGLEDSILILNVENLYQSFNDSIKILDENNGLLNVIKSVDGNEPSFLFENVSILAYYPDYSLYFFRLKGIDKEFVYVEYNNMIARLVNKGLKYEIISFEKYLLKGYLSTDNQIKIYADKAMTKPILLNPLQGYIFKISKVSGDFIYVKCEKECEGCVGTQEIKGWIKWRGEDGKLKIKIRLQC